MSIFGTIMSKVFGTHPASAAPAPTPAPPATTSARPSTTANETTGKATTGQDAPANANASTGGSAPTAPSTAPSSAGASAPSAPSTAPSSVDIAAVLDGMEEKGGQKLDWRRSIVDLMKLLGMDSSLSARKELAHELHYTGDTNDSAAMNMWLHKEVMTKFAENGGKLPPDLH